MPRVRAVDWKPGLNKVQMTQVLRGDAELRLRDAKAATDEFLDGEILEFIIEDESRARRLAEGLEAIGVVVEYEE